MSQLQRTLNDTCRMIIDVSFDVGPNEAQFVSVMHSDRMDRDLSPRSRSCFRRHLIQCYSGTSGLPGG